MNYIYDFNTNVDKQESPFSKKLKWFCFNNNLEQIIKNPTRNCSSSSSTIDLILTSNKDKIKAYGNIETYVSDHEAIFFNRKVYQNKKSYDPVRGRHTKTSKKCIHQRNR